MYDSASKQIVRVIGHKNPDTDSICSAIAYAYLKNQISDIKHQPRRAGDVNRETAFVLKHFGVEKPRLTADVSPQIKNIDIRQQDGVNAEMSLREAWKTMVDQQIDTLCVIDDNNDLLGIITIKDIASANMNLFDNGILSEARTSYQNLLSTLEGKMLVGDPDGIITKGNILVGTSPEAMEEAVKDGDIVLVTNRYEAQTCAIDCGASCIIVCMDSSVPKTILTRAQKAGCSVIQTHYDTYAAARLCSMAAPIRHFMITDMVTFSVNTPVDDARNTMASLRHRYFPIVDEDGRYAGVISRRNFLNLHKKKVILVDHNETTQTVDGLDQAQLLEVIDHHRIGNLETGGPVYFRNEPVGCTSTILYSMFNENGVEIPKEIAGLMLSAILSDTLVFHSPTCTQRDKIAAAKLAEIAGENIEEYAEKMFEAGDDLTGRSAEDILHADYKEFVFGDHSFAVGQGFFMSKGSYRAAEELLTPYLKEVIKQSGVSMIFYMLTNVREQSTLLLFTGDGAEQIVASAFGKPVENGHVLLPGVVSRKSQLIPQLRASMQAQ